MEEVKVEKKLPPFFGQTVSRAKITTCVGSFLFLHEWRDVIKDPLVVQRRRGGEDFFISQVRTNYYNYHKRIEENWTIGQTDCDFPSLLMSISLPVIFLLFLNLFDSNRRPHFPIRLPPPSPTFPTKYLLRVAIFRLFLEQKKMKHNKLRRGKIHTKNTSAGVFRDLPR